ncbi:unnamed protein product [Durusdinium trenchii]|uniref:Fungal lipase-type domain-containing protein n=1 Tax=Durusdinium trenchii TaxID=1381693 RepID=A0ABP0PPB1_9DINO
MRTPRRMSSGRSSCSVFEDREQLQTGRQTLRWCRTSRSSRSRAFGFKRVGPVPKSAEGLVHVDALVEKFLAALQEEDPSSLHAVLLCGHSLGGALAQVTAMLAYQEVLRGRLGSDVARLLSRLRCFTLAAPQPFAVDPQGDAGKALEWMSHAVNYVNNQDWVPRLPGSVEFLEKAAPGCKIDMDLEFLKLFRTVTTTIFLTSRASETLTPAEASQRLAESAPLKLLGGLAEHEVRSYCEQIFTTFGATSHLFGHGASSWTSSGYDGGSKGMGTSRCGAYKSKEGSCYEGQWKDGLPEGLGVLKWPNGSYFQGEWRAGKRNGQGLLIYPDGSSFTGEWKDDQRNGSGVRKYPDGSLFKGEWKDTPFFGRGVCEGGALKYRRLLERVRKGEKWRTRRLAWASLRGLMGALSTGSGEFAMDADDVPMTGRLRRVETEASVSQAELKDVKEEAKVGGSRYIFATPNGFICRILDVESWSQACTTWSLHPHSATKKRPEGGAPHGNVKLSRHSTRH